MGAPTRGVMTSLSLLIAVRVLGITLIVTGFLAYAKSLGATSLQAGLAFGAYPLALALFLTPVGHLSDRFGRRNVMLAGLALAAAGAIVAALASTWWLLAIGRLISGVGAVNGVALAVAGEVGPAETRTRRFAVLGAAAGGGVVLGLVLGALLEPLVGVRGLLWAFALANLLVLPLPLAIPARSAPGRGTGGTGTGQTSSGPTRLVRSPWVLLGLAAFCVNLSLTILLLLLRPLLALSGLAFTAALLAMLIPGGLGMFVASRLADKGRAREVGIAAGALLGLAPIALVVGAPLALAIAAGVLFFLAHSSLSSLLPSLLAGAASEDRRGAAQGVQSTLQYLGSFAGSAVAGLLAGAPLGLAAAFVASGAVCAGAIAIVANARRA